VPFDLQTAIVAGAGAPILVIMPLLIYIPRLLLRTRGKLDSNERRRLQELSARWTERFLFSFMLWVQFISFIAASTAINATPTPGTACNGDAFRSTSSPDGSDASCYNSQLGGAHALGTFITVGLCFVYPWFQWKKCRQINYLNLEDDEQTCIRYGVFFDAYAGGSRRYFGLLNFFQMTVLVATLRLWLKTDDVGLAISNIVCCAILILLFLVGAPSADQIPVDIACLNLKLNVPIGDIIESYFLAVQIISLVFPLVLKAQYPINTDVSAPVLMDWGCQISRFTHASRSLSETGHRIRP